MRNIKFEIKIRRKDGFDSPITEIVSLHDLITKDSCLFNEFLWEVVYERQFTGFKIKDKDLYEGDILHFTHHKGYNLGSFVAKVIWIQSDGAWGYELNGYEYAFNAADEVQHDILDYCEIIGNAFEHPELVS